ncbi:hypothetical protein OHS33_37750 (plasmid) [Streptomyces sp. NBC_00536]|uniref:hypothetical protein n=1 Tax=Streptomyces sp. NBC_00536 TaxID=2975769 RepID=UPI002E80AA43|nr:hypothetical protein [Streptomyces sp. NBC_00536]WUC84149.1 hypothetical protein OHS33_37750 [Streptomyces sp. NBC_00536]
MRRTVATTTITATAAVLLAGCGTAPGRGGGPAAIAPVASANAPCPVSRNEPGAGQAPPTTIDGTPANTPEGTRLSQAIGEQGRGAFADVYSTQVTDSPPGRVALCVTDLARGRLLVLAAHRADPGADPARADLYLARFTHKDLVAAAGRIVRLRDALPVYAAYPSGDANGVYVLTSAEGVASAEFKSRLERAAGEGISVTLTEGAPTSATTPSPR